MRPPTVLAIGGSDPGGGAGIQADLKAIHAHGAYGMAAVAALTVQNTHGVRAVQPVEPAWLHAQLRAVLDDLPVDAVKIGMLGSAGNVRAVLDALADWRGALVVDPVGVAKGGRTLQDAATLEALQALAARATLTTPNLDEWPWFSAGTRLRKGGHGAGAALEDVLLDGAGRELARWTHPRVDTPHTHGTGCTLASAIAARLAAGDALEAACAAGIAYVQRQIRASAAGLGTGRGPLWQLRD